VEALAAAPEDEVLRLWAGLGYYSRARNLHKAARMIMERGGFPEDPESIRALPGVGDYTAAAICSIALHKSAAAVDGNVLRIIARLDALRDNVLDASAKKTVTGLVTAKLPPAGEGPCGPGAFTEALMELGETVCLPKEPHCDVCPWEDICLARRNGCQNELPVREKKTERKKECRIAVLIRSEEDELRFWMRKRPSSGMLAGMWELPNIVVQEEDPSLSAIETLFRKQTGLFLRLGGFLGTVHHVFTHREWDLAVYEASLADKSPGNADEEGENGRTETAGTGNYRPVSAADPEVAVPAPFKKAMELYANPDKSHR
jgi:A/G-specific adenine glycosylase